MSQRPNEQVETAACALGPTFADIDEETSVHVFARRPFYLTSHLSEVVQAQLVEAVRLSGGEADSLEDAFAFADQGLINYTRLRDPSSKTEFAVFEFSRGDTSVGAIFKDDELEPRARISDGSIEDCSAFVKRSLICMFPETYGELLDNWNGSIPEARELVAPSELTDLKRNQLIKALQVLGHSDVLTIGRFRISR